jgi:type I restriction enzyme M protein
MCFNQDIVALMPDHERLLPDFLLWWLKGAEQRILAEGIKPGVTVQSFHSGYLKSFEMPIPPLEIQQAIVAEIAAERAMVDANRELIARFEKKIETAIACVWGGADEEVT